MPTVGTFLLQTAAMAVLQSVLPARAAWSVEAVLWTLPMPDVLARSRVSQLVYNIKLLSTQRSAVHAWHCCWSSQPLEATCKA